MVTIETETRIRGEKRHGRKQRNTVITENRILQLRIEDDCTGRVNNCNTQDDAEHSCESGVRLVIEDINGKSFPAHKDF